LAKIFFAQFRFSFHPFHFFVQLDSLSILQPGVCHSHARAHIWTNLTSLAFLHFISYTQLNRSHLSQVHDAWYVQHRSDAQC